MKSFFRVLVVDDDPNVCEIIRLYFKEQHIEMIEAHDGPSALSLVQEKNPNVIILDIMMPGMDGYEACREIRKVSEVPIIMLSAKSEEFDKVLGLELGADDYVTKPFSPRELVARIKAIFRRMEKKDPATEMESIQTVYELGDLKINIERREVTIFEEVIELRPKEFDLLVHLAKSPGSVYTREQLLEQVWGYDFFGDMRTVDVHIKKLRKKLQQLNRECIQTVWGVGYKFEAAL